MFKVLGGSLWLYWPGVYFSDNFPLHFKYNRNFVLFSSNFSGTYRYQFCTTAVACATQKICSDAMAKNGITMKRIFHGPLIICVKSWVVHAPGMSGTFSSSPRVSDPDMHHGMCVAHMPWCMLGSLTSNFLWVHWLGKLSRHSRRMRYQQFYVSGKRLIDLICDRKGVSEMGPDTKLQLNT